MSVAAGATLDFSQVLKGIGQGFLYHFQPIVDRCAFQERLLVFVGQAEVARDGIGQMPEFGYGGLRSGPA